MTSSSKLVLAALGILLVSASLWAQDQPSLGDLARQQRAQKDQKAQKAPAKDAKPAKVITNELISEHASVEGTQKTGPAQKSDTPPPVKPSADAPKQTAEFWTSQIQALKSQVDILQKEINVTQESIQFAPANCVENCVQWNEQQQQKQKEVERMQGQLEEQKTRLEEMQDSARQQGYGSSVYDP